MKNSIYPCLWLDGKAREAARFYCSVFSDSKITSDSEVVTAFESSGQKFMCLNGGPKYSPNPSISFFVIGESLEETEETWRRLSEEGTILMPLDKYDWSEKYGWVQDKFGVSWQVASGKIEDTGQKFTPSLLFTGEQHGNAEAAIRFYTSVFDNSSIAGILKYSANDRDLEGTVKHAQFSLGNYICMAMDNSTSQPFAFNEGISFVVDCETQEEIDYYWNRLTEGGEESMCGWLKDKFGVSWQIVPVILGQLMGDPERSERVIQAFLQMRKFDIEKLKSA